MKESREQIQDIVFVYMLGVHGFRGLDYSCKKMHCHGDRHAVNSNVRLPKRRLRSHGVNGAPAHGADLLRIVHNPSN